MHARDQYELLDFGNGRKLERFGSEVLDRPAPVAEQIAPADPRSWSAATARFEREHGGGDGPQRGRWIGTAASEAASTWLCRCGSMTFELKRTDFGHVGLFPEQAENWDWLAAQAQRLRSPSGTPPKFLNLFAYTGAATLAAAAAGAHVTHVDAARNTVAWARRNAALSGLSDAPIRWIADDALTFVRREQRRKNCYECIVLDPPSYGHGPRGQPWRIDRDLAGLLSACAELLASDAACLLFSCHAPEIGPREAAELVNQAISATRPGSTVRAEATEIMLRTADGRTLPAGVAARWRQ